MSHRILAQPSYQSIKRVPVNILAKAQEVLRSEGAAVLELADRLDHHFCDAVEMILASRGAMIVTGVGKAGIIGQKLTATFASLGTRAHFMHPAEAFHGDLGRIHADDLVIILSHSGESSEVVQLLPALADFKTPIIAMTGQPESTVAKSAKVVLSTYVQEEACPLGLAPTNSTTAMLALGDALALTVSEIKGFREVDFARFHPGGSLGRQLSSVDEQMRPLSECRIASASATIREVLVVSSKPGRRTGAIMLVDESEQLVGMFTDSDLARLFEGRNEGALDGPISAMMTKHPYQVLTGSRFMDAFHEMASKKISELPVVSKEGKPLGLLDVTDIVAQVEDAAQSARTEQITKPATPSVRIFEDRANVG